MNNHIENVLRSHFEPEIEMMPGQIFDALLRGEPVESSSVKGAKQIDVGSAVAVLTLALEAIKFANEVYQKNKSKKSTHQEVINKINNEYSDIIGVLGEDGLEEFVSEITALAKE